MKQSLLLILAVTCISINAQDFKVTSPSGNIALNFHNSDKLTYEVCFDGTKVIDCSPLGFVFQEEPNMDGRFKVIGEPSIQSKVESWTPIVKNRHSSISVPYNSLSLDLKEDSGEYRKMGIEFRVMDDAVAFRYTLYPNGKICHRTIMKELTGFKIPSNSFLWVPDFTYSGKGGYQSPQEGSFRRTPISEISETVHSGLPGLIKINQDTWLAITEANIDNYPGFYLGHDKSQSDNEGDLLFTKLSPRFGYLEDGPKAFFDSELYTPWRVIFIGHNPGKFVESEVIRSLNEPCTLDEDASEWIKPGISIWDHWWSGDVKMEQDVIKEYIDFASSEGWPYAIIDWAWYGPFNTPSADITRPTDKINIPELVEYAKSKNVKLWLWIYSEDVNRNCNWKKAFPLYRSWGIAGVKIDFMDRDDQEMINWYRQIIKATAENHLMLNFHGAYKPDGIERTYPNIITREGVLGGEGYKWTKDVTPEHNVTLAFTRMIAGPMDYTPGGFLNVTSDKFKCQTPTLVCNSRCAELAKFVVYESPLTVSCDHPKHVMNQAGADFLSIVPTEWDDTHFIAGCPDEYVAIARKNGDKWYIGVLNNSKERQITLDLSFAGGNDKDLEVEYWKDGKDVTKDATSTVHKKTIVKKGKPITLNLAPAGGYVAVLTYSNKL